MSILNNPSRHPEDFLNPVSVYSPEDMLRLSAYNRKIKEPYYDSMPRQEVIPESQLPYATEHIDLATGEIVMGPLSLLESNRLAGAMGHTGGMWGQSAQHQQLAANLIFAGRKGFSDYVNEEGEKEAEWLNLDYENEHFLRQWISRMAGSNWLKGFTGSSETDITGIGMVRHFEPLSISGDGWYDTPYDMFEIEPDERYSTEYMYDLMYRVNPGYMARLEELGADPTYFENARNQHEWFYMANMLIQMNYISQSAMWSDDTSPAIKHMAGGLYSFVVDGILNEPDMVGELAISLLLAGLTSGASLVNVARLVHKVGRGLNVSLDFRKLASSVTKMNKYNRVTSYLPSAIPHTLINKALKKQGKELTYWGSYNPLTRIFWGNAAEGALTGSLAEIRNQGNKIQWGQMEEYDWGQVGVQGLLEAGLTPLINPNFVKGMQALQFMGGQVGKGGLAVGRLVNPRGLDILGPKIRDTINISIGNMRIGGKNLQATEQFITSSLVASRLQSQLQALDTSGREVSDARVNGILAMIIQDSDVSQINNVEQDLATIINEVTDTEGNIDLSRIDLVRTVAKLTAINAKRTGKTNAEVIERETGSFFLMSGEKIAYERNTLGKLKPDGSDPATKDNEWTGAEVLEDIFGGPEIKIEEFMDEAMRAEVNQVLARQHIDVNSATHTQLKEAWEVVLSEQTEILTEAAKIKIAESSALIQEAHTLITNTMDALGDTTGSVYEFLSAQNWHSPAYKARGEQISMVSEAINTAFNKLRAYKQEQGAKASRKDADRILQSVDKIKPRATNGKKILKAVAKALGIELKAKDSIAQIKIHIGNKLQAPDSSVDYSENVEAFAELFAAFEEDPGSYGPHRFVTEEEAAMEKELNEEWITLVTHYHNLINNTNPKFLDTIAPYHQSIHALLARFDKEFDVRTEALVEEDQKDFTIEVVGTKTEDTVTEFKTTRLRIVDADGTVVSEGAGKIIYHTKEDLELSEGTEPLPEVTLKETEVTPEETEVTPEETEDGDDFVDWMDAEAKKRTGADTEPPKVDTTVSTKPLPNLELETVYEVLSRLRDTAATRADTRLVRKLEQLTKKLRKFEGEHLDSLPITETIVDIKRRQQEIVERTEAINKEYYSIPGFKEAVVAEEASRILGAIIAKGKKNKISKKDQEMIEAWEDHYKVKTKGDWMKRVKALHKATTKAINKAMKGFYELNDKYEVELAVINLEEYGLNRELNAETFKGYTTTLKARSAENTGYTLASARELGVRIKEARKDIENLQTAWDEHWRTATQMDFDTLKWMYFHDNLPMLEKIINKYKEGPYTKKHLEEYFEKAQKNRHRQIGKMNISRLLLSSDDINTLGKAIVEDGAILVDDFGPDRTLYVEVTSLERAELLAEGKGETVAATTTAEVALSLSTYTNRLLYLFNTSGWSTHPTVSYGMLKKALPADIRNLRIELMFEQAAVDKTKIYDHGNVLDLEFRREDVKAILVSLITRLDAGMKKRYEYTAQHLLEALRNPSDTTSKYSFYAALSIVSQMQKAVLTGYRAEFLANEETHGNGYKILLDSKKKPQKWGNKTDFLNMLTVAFNARLASYSTEGRGDKGIILGRIWEALGQEGPLRTLTREEVTKGLGVYLMVDSETYFTALGDGTKDYLDAYTAGESLADFVLGKMPGTQHVVLDEANQMEAVDNYNDIFTEKQKRHKQSEEDLTGAPSKKILPPRIHGVTKFGPKNEWDIMQVLEDEILRNRVKWAVNVELTPAIRKQWLNPKRQSMKGELHSVGRRVPMRLSPYISGKWGPGKPMSRTDLGKALFEMQLDWVPIVQSFIHDAVYGTKLWYDSKAATSVEGLTTGFPTVVPPSNLGFLAVLTDLNPQMLGNTKNPFIQLVLEQGLKTESEGMGTETFNYNDQTWQGFHLYNLMALAKEDIDGMLVGLSSLAKEADIQWTVELIDKYVERGLEWSIELLGDVKGEGALDVFKEMFASVGITEGTTLDTLTPSDKLTVIREEIFKPDLLRLLYGGGLPAAYKHWHGKKGKDGLEALKKVGINLTPQNMIDLSHFLYGAFQWNNTRILKDVMGIAELKPKAFDFLSLKEAGGFEVAKTLKVVEGERHRKRISDLNVEAREKFDSLDEADRKFMKFIISMEDAIMLIEARQRDRAEFTNIPLQDLQTEDAGRIQEAKDYMDSLGTEALTEENIARVNEILTGNIVPWKDVQALRSQNLANSVAHTMDMTSMRIQARLEGYTFNEEDLMGLQDQALYFTYVRSHDSKRFYHTVFDRLNIHPHNMDASKIRSNEDIETYNKLTEEFASQGVDNTPRQVGLSDAQVAAIAKMIEDGESSLGMWNIDVNPMQQAKQKYKLNPDGSFVNEADKVKWRTQAEQHIEDMLIRDEMMYEASFGPLPIKEYLQGGTVKIGGKDAHIFSELDSEAMIGEITGRWRNRSKEADQEYIDLIELLTEYEGKAYTDPAFKTIIGRIAKWRGVPISSIENSTIITAETGTMRWAQEWKGVIMQDMSTPQQPDALLEEGREFGAKAPKYQLMSTPDPDPIYSAVGVATAFKAGYAAMRPMIAEVAWDDVGSLELRRLYYQGKIDEFEGAIGDITKIEGESLDQIIPPEQRTDIDMMDPKQKVLFPELDTNNVRSILSPFSKTVSNVSYRLKMDMDAWALDQGWDMKMIEKDPSLYTNIYYMMKLDDMFGYVSSTVTPTRDTSIPYTVMARINRINQMSKTEAPEEIALAKLALYEEIRTLYRLSEAIKQREHSYIVGHEKGAVTGIVALPTDTDLTYEELLRREITGPNRLSTALKKGGIRGDAFSIIGEPMNEDERILFDALREGTLTIQNIDANMLFTALSRQQDIMEVIHARMKEDPRITEEQLKAFTEGSYTSAFDPNGKNGMTITELLDLVVLGIHVAKKRSQSNYALQLLIGQTDTDTPDAITPLSMQFVTDSEVHSAVKRDPLASGIHLSPTTVVGPTIKVALTPETIFEALNTHSNFAMMEMIEYAIRTGQHINTRETILADGTSVRTPIEALSSRMKADQGFGFAEDRAYQQNLLEAFRFLAGDTAENIYTVKDDTRAINEFLDGRKYLSNSVEMILTEGAAPINLPIYKASFIAPVQKILRRLNAYSRSHGISEDIIQLTRTNSINLLMVLGFKLRNPDMGAKELAVVMPFLLDKKTEGETGLETLEDLLADADVIYTEIAKEIKWREHDKINLQNSPSARTGDPYRSNWKSRAVPFMWLARSFWDNAKYDTLKQHQQMGGDAFYTEVFRPWIDKQWAVTRQHYTQGDDPQILKFLEDNQDVLIYMAYEDGIQTMFEDRGQGVNPLLLGMDERWRKITELNPQSTKRWAKKKRLREDFGRTDSWVHLSRLLTNIDTLTGNTINERTADILRSTLGYFATHSPEMLVDLRFELKPLTGTKVAFGQKIAAGDEAVGTPGYVIGLDPTKVSSMDTTTAVEVIFHELAEIGILKFIKEDSAEWQNIVSVLSEPKNEKLLTDIVMAHEGNLSNTNVKAKLEYYRSAPNELVAAFASYYLSARILGDPDGVVSNIEKMTGMARVKHMFTKVFKWIGDIYQSMAHVFVAYQDSNPREFDALMTMLDTVFGVGGRPDVGNPTSERRYMKNFQLDPTFEIAGEMAEGAVDDEGFRAFIKEYAELEAKRKVLETEKAEQRRGRNVHTTGEHSIEGITQRMIELDGLMRKNGYGMVDGSEGIHSMGLTRRQQLITDRSNKYKYRADSKNNNIQLDGVRLLKEGSSIEKAAYAYSMLDNMIEYLDSFLVQGIAGGIRTSLNRSEGVLSPWVYKHVIQFLKSGILSSSGANKTYNSPHVLAVVLSNMLIDGASITMSSVMPLRDSIVSAQDAHSRSMGFEKALNNQWYADVIRSFNKSRNYKVAEENGSLDEAYTQLKVAALRLTIGQEVDISGYAKETQDSLKEVAESFKSFTNTLFNLNRNNGRTYMDSDVEIIPWLIKKEGTDVSRLSAATSARSVLKEFLDTKIRKSSESYAHPAILYMADLLPTMNNLEGSLKSLKKRFPGWYKYLGSRALEHFNRIKKEDASGQTGLVGFLLGDLSDIKIKAWQMTLTEILSAHGTKNISWDEVSRFTGKDIEKGQMAHEVEAIHSIYNSTLEGGGSRETTLRKRGVELIQFKKTNENDLMASWHSSSQIINGQWNSGLGFLTDAFISRIGHQAFFVYDNMWTPKVSEVMHDPVMQDFLELTPDELARTVSKTTGHYAHEIDMFAPITKSNLHFGEVIQLYKEVLGNENFKVTDGTGVYLTGKEQKELVEGLKILERKYAVLRGVAAKIGTDEDVILGGLVDSSSWIVKSVYGTNLALATSLVEGSLAGIFATMGKDRITGILYPFTQQLNVMFKADNKVAKETLYGLRLAMGDMTPGLGFKGLKARLTTRTAGESGVEAGVRGTIAIDTDPVSHGKQQYLKNWSNEATRYASKVNEQIKSQIDLNMRVFWMHKVDDGSWLKMIKLLKEKGITDFKQEVTDTSSMKVWKGIAQESGWGKKQWRSAMFLANHGLMTEEAYNTFIEMEQGGRELKGNKETFYILPDMRQWAQLNTDASTPAGQRLLNDRMNIYYNLRTAMQKHIYTIMMEPNVLDLMVAPNSLMLILHQYRTYPMLFGANRIIRDSSTYDPGVWVTRIITNAILDTMYTVVTRMAGGYLIQEQLEDLQENPGTMVATLGSRLPFFGFWGSAGAELLMAIAIASKYIRSDALSPIALSGFLKTIDNLLETGVGLAQTIVPGGKNWDDTDTAAAVNLLRVIPYVGESIVRSVIHAAIREGNTRGSYSKYGNSGGRFLTMGATQDMVEANPMLLLQDLLRELGPDLFPEDIRELPYEEYEAIRRNAHNLQTEEEAAIENQGQPTAQPEADVSEPQVPDRGYIRAPESL